jgi:dTDP-4-dehydrorhamnose 3,5-epimerase
MDNGAMDPHEMLRLVSRTFTLSVELLPRTLRDALTLAYLLFRVSDGIEDHPSLPAERKAELLRLWAAVLRGELPCDALTSRLSGLDNRDPEVYVAQHADVLLAELSYLPEALLNAIVPHAVATAQGMARWQENGPRVDNEAELDDYMHEVAGRVGYLVTEIFAWHVPELATRREELMPVARECGLALQTVNVIRGLRKDYERGWIFVPRSFCEAAGLEPEQLFDSAHHSAATRVVSTLTDKAERHLRGGIAYVLAVPQWHHRVRLACIWPSLFAARTLALSRNNPQVLRGEAKMSRAEVKQVVRDSSLWGWSNRWYRHYFDRLLPPVDMEIEALALPEVKLIRPKVFADGRGFFLETYQRPRYEAAGIGCDFVQDNHSHSVKDTLRGLHFQRQPGQAKLVTVLAGRIYDVAVDIRPSSSTYGRWVGVYLDANTPTQLFVPVGFAHGFCVVSDEADVQYKCSSLYDPQQERGFAWNDPEVGVDWPLDGPPLLSDRDRQAARLRDVADELG